MKKEETRIALITGASRGLGESLAGALARRGWTLILNARGEPALDTVRRRLEQETRVFAVAGSVANHQIRKALADAAQEAGGLDALINNASILGPSPQPRLLDYSIETLADVYAVNTFAPLALIQAVRGSLRSGARIVNVTSDAGVEAYEGWGGYGSSKAALEHISAIMAAEEPQWRVYRVDPGDMRTQMHQEAFPGEDISDRPLPEVSVPGIVELLEGDYPSGRYAARELTGRESS